MRWMFVVLLSALASCAGVGLPVLAHADAKGEGAWLELDVRGWAPTLSGSVRSSANGGAATDADYDRTLGLNTQQRFYWPRAALHFTDRQRLTGSWLLMRYAGDSTVSQAFTFGGTTYTVGEGIHSDLELTDVTIGYQFDWLKTPHLSANVNLQTHVLSLDATVRGNTLGTVQEDFTVPVPTIGGGLRAWPFPWLKLSGDFNIFTAGVSGFQGELIDSEAGVTISPWEWLGLGVGYRYFRGLARDIDSGDQIDWLQEGPFVVLTLRPF